ncbi:discoidin domain-containing protein [Actinopolymorpha alba]|uniref:discoidin domain-containing protein n=1 Tax=Actinopolymorpha alba TaxID=533267 RepID=UPI000372ADCF|nr:discoidin domain-containing protein [Actinopolymorpha alba]
MLRHLRAALPLLLFGVLLVSTVQAPARGDTGLPAGSEDALARAYYQLLLQNTRFQESTWNAELGSYGIESWDVVGTLGNAVLLKFGTYDATVAGVDKATLREHTVRSIAKAVARNRFVDPVNGTWGARIYWDATMEAYLADAAHLMWDELDATTRANVDTMTRGEATYLADVGANPTDPSREGGTTNGLAGGYLKDTKLEEMGARTMMLSAADAYLPNDPDAPRWREWLDRWTLNMPGLPVADRVNPAVVAGRPVQEWNTAQNVFDTFTSENHDTWNGMYQQSASTYPGRNVVRYLLTGQRVPQSQITLPNNDELTEVLNRLGTSAGVPVEHMIADRQHLYGRSLIPLTFRAMVNGDRLAARAERMLAASLPAYVAWPPVGRLVKSNEGTKYETEARAEVAYAYLLHYWRDRLAGDVRPVSEAEYFSRVSGVTDFGAVPGYVAHQTSRSLAIPTTKPGYTKFAFLPNHDDWFVNPASKSPSFLPSVATPDSFTSRTYTKVRDGIDATATVVRRGSSYAGFTTLPDGTIAYATTGTGDDEGYLRLFNLSMPGMPGLDGNRTFTTAAGSVTLAADNHGRGGTETLEFPATRARHLRMVGVQAQSQWGYSMYEFEAYGSDGDVNLALAKPATASTSFGASSTPDKAVDGDHATRWANSAQERPTMKGWWAVDLGAEADVDRVKIHWQEDAWPFNYRIEASLDGQTWKTVAGVPRWTTLDGDWLNVDGRAGFVISGSTNPIGVAPTAVALSHGPAVGSAGMVVQGYPAQSPEETARLSRAPQPSGGPAALRAALNSAYLSVFNLGDAPLDKVGLTVPQAGSKRVVYRGAQTLTRDGLSYAVSLAAGSAGVELPRFEVSSNDSLTGLEIEVGDSHNATVRNPGPTAAVVRLTSIVTGESRSVRVRPGQVVPVTFTVGVRTPTADLARDRITYPSSPLPVGMTDPDRAVDANPATAWTPGASDRRIVVNLGSANQIRTVTPRWTSGAVPSYTVEVSDDGVTWKPFTSGTTGRYVSLHVGTWRRGDASLAELQVMP